MSIVSLKQSRRHSRQPLAQFSSSYLCSDFLELVHCSVILYCCTAKASPINKSSLHVLWNVNRSVLGYQLTFFLLTSALKVHISNTSQTKILCIAQLKRKCYHIMQFSSHWNSFNFLLSPPFDHILKTFFFQFRQIFYFIFFYFFGSLH